jgi:tetratricopeptide (TPR) repeat protein
MHYKNTDKLADEIGRELGVQYLLEGSVRRAAGRVRITAQLIQVSDQTHLWAENYERELADIFAVQNEVAERIADSLALHLLPEQEARLIDAKSVHPEAYEAYLKGVYHWNKRTRDGLERSIEHFERAIVLDPDYAPAHAGIAMSLGALRGWGFVRREEVNTKIRAAVTKALQLDETLPSVHAAIATYLPASTSADRESRFKRAIDLNPSYATAYQWYAHLLVEQGRVEEAIASLEMAARLDPLSLIIGAEYGYILYVSRQYDRAIEQCRKVLEMDATFGPANLHLGIALMGKGRVESALPSLKAAVTHSGGGAVYEALLGYAYARLGHDDDVAKLLADFEEKLASDLPYAFPIAAVYIGLGDSDAAFLWLDRSIDEGAYYIKALNVDPMFDSLRDDPRFEDLLRRAGLSSG